MPTSIVLTIHSYIGDVPGFVGVAVKVTGTSSHTGFAEAEIFTLTGTKGITVIVIGFEIAGLPVTQGAFEVSVQVTWSPLFGA